MDALAKELRGKGGKIIGEKTEEEEEDDDDDSGEESGSDDVEDSGDDSVSDYEMPLPQPSKTKKRPAPEISDKKAGFQVVPQQSKFQKPRGDSYLF